MELTDETNNPVIKVNNKGVFGLSFNFEASQNYYAEFELAKFDSLINNQVVGISNNLTATGTPTEGLYWEGFKTNNNGWEIATSKYVTSWDINRMWAPSDLANKRKNSPELDLKNKATKMAVARVGDTFYYFYNDKLFSVNEYPELKGISTYPGIITWAGDQDKVIPTSFSKFNFIKNSEDVMHNIDAVLVLNYEKNGVDNYIGGATFLEMYDAFRLGKKIYMLNDIPKGLLEDEIIGFKPVIIHGDLSKIK